MKENKLETKASVAEPRFARGEVSLHFDENVPLCFLLSSKDELRDSP